MYHVLGRGQVHFLLFYRFNEAITSAPHLHACDGEFANESPTPLVGFARRSNVGGEYTAK